MSIIKDIFLETESKVAETVNNEIKNRKFRNTGRRKKYYGIKIYSM